MLLGRGAYIEDPWASSLLIVLDHSRELWDEAPVECEEIGVSSSVLLGAGAESQV